MRILRRNLHSTSAAKATKAIIAALALLGACAVRHAQATPAVDPASARAFLGGRTGKIAYLKGYDTKVYYIDFSDSVLVEHKVSDDPYSLSPMISPDGTRIVYEQGSAIWIRDLVANSPSRSLIYSRAVVPGQTMEPHWWIDPKTKDEYIQFTTGIIGDHEWPPKSGSTYLVKVVDNKPASQPLLLLPFLMSAARSKSGLWGGTGHHSVGMYKFYPDKIDNALNAMKNWLDSGVILACNTSISPSNDPLKQNRIMHLHSGGQMMGGKAYENHKAVLIRSWDDVDPDHPLWWMGTLGDRVEDDGSGNLFWGAPEWSTDEDYFTLTGSKDVDGVDTADLYIAKLNLTGETKLLRVVKGEGKNVYSHLWVKEGVAPAKIHLDSAGLGFNSFRKDTADPAAKTVTVTNAGDGTLPSLTLGALPAWLKITLVGNGTNNVKLVNQVRRDSLAFGTYTAKVSVSFGHGVDSTAYTVVFRYSDPVLTSLKPLPAHAVVPAGDSIRLDAVGLDQAGNTFANQPAVAWSGTGALKPSADGWFRADTAAWRTYKAIGTAGALTCTTTVTVVRKLLRIDAGSPAGQAAPGWVGDGTYALGGSTASAAPAFDLSALAAIADRAPLPVYQNWRKDFTGYRFPDLPNARYKVRMHLVSPQPGSAGSLTVKLEGTKVLDAYTLPASSDASLRAADMREAAVTVSDGNGLSLDAAGTGAAPALAGLEIFDIGSPPVDLHSPNGGEKVAVGDTLSIRWASDSTITSCGVQVSVDSGAKWIPLTRRRSVAVGDSDWQDFRWVIPDSLDGSSMVGARTLISVYDYFGSDRDRSDQVFTILPGSSAIRPALRRGPDGLASAHWEGSRLVLDVEGAGPWQAFLADTRGRMLRRFAFSGSGRRILDAGILSRGVYRLYLTGVTGRERPQSRLLPLLP